MSDPGGRVVVFPSAGEQFGRYRVDRVVGHGGMGVVYQATDPTLGRAVALKIIQPTLAADPRFRQRFEREATILARLRSQHIVQILEYGETDGTLFLVTEFVPDGDLEAWLGRYGALGARSALHLLRPICEALDDAHRAGVVHRDVKPSNVLLWQRTPGELVPYLCDVGIAADSNDAPTRTGTVIGSLPYMAPERHLGQAATPRGDVYSAGCVLWAALTGQAPYAGTDFQLMQAHLNEPVPQLPPSTPGAAVINPLLQRSMAKDPQQRYATAGEFAEAIGAALAAPEVPDAPIAPPDPTAQAWRGPAAPPTVPPPMAPPPAGAPPVAGVPTPMPEPTFMSSAKLPPPGGPAPSAPLGWPSMPPAPAAPRRRRWPLYVAAGVALVLVVGGGATAWSYATGRLGFGPLSGDDKAVARTLSDVPQPTWADPAQRLCAGDALVRDQRAKKLQADGVVKRDDSAATGWSLTGTWTEADATAYMSAVLGCVGDWSGTVATTWHLSSTACLHDIGTQAMAQYFAADLKPKDASSAATGRTATIAKLDSCYAVAPSSPQLTATSGYRSVHFKVTGSKATDGTSQTQVHDSGGWTAFHGQTVVERTNRGGDRACDSARTTTTYAWGATRTATGSACGTAKPAALWWKKAEHCSSSPGCTQWNLHYSGLPSIAFTTLKYRQNHGNCRSQSGRCTFRVLTDDSGRGTAGSWSAFPGYHQFFTATMAGMTAVLPDHAR